MKIFTDCFQKYYETLLAHGITGNRCIFLHTSTADTDGTYHFSLNNNGNTAAKGHDFTVIGLRILIEKFFKEDVLVKEASHGKEALRLSDIFLPDLIFMDIKMPGMNGIEASKFIKKNTLK